MIWILIVNNNGDKKLFSHNKKKINDKIIDRVNPVDNVWSVEKKYLIMEKKKMKKKLKIKIMNN